MRIYRTYQLCLIAAAIIVLMLLERGRRDCARERGQYVRGLFWMECIRR